MSSSMSDEVSLTLAAHYASEGVPLVLWPRDILPTCPPPPPSVPEWATVEAWLAELPRLRGCFCEGEALALMESFPALPGEEF